MNSNNENKELQALISLVDEPNELLFSKVRDKIFDYGYAAIPMLESAWESSLDQLVQQRIIELIQQIQQQYLVKELRNWLESGHDDLLKGFLIMTRFQYPELDVNAITREVGKIVQDVWLELNQDLTPLEKTKVLNHVLYDIHKFGGNTANIQLPDNFYLKPLLESHKGNPLSLGMLYIIIARSLRIPVFGVDLPRHFVLAYVDEAEGSKAKNADKEQVLFYLNPFNKGAVFTKNEIDLYVRQLKLEQQDRFYKPCSNKDIIHRMISGLMESYKAASNEEKVDSLNQLLDLLGQ